MKLSPWFNPRTDPPVHDGIYEVMYWNNSVDKREWVDGRWVGVLWCFPTAFIKSWRGIDRGRI